MIPQQTTNALDKLPDVELSGHAEESTYLVARLLMRFDDWLLNLVGLGHDHALFTWIYVILVFLVSIGVGYVAKWIILNVVRRIGKHLLSDWYQNLTSVQFFSKACRIIPALVFVIFLKFTMTGKAELEDWLNRLTWVYIVYVIAYGLGQVADTIWKHIDERENRRKLPLHGIVQLVKGIIWIVAAIIFLAILFDKSPGSLLAGLGVFASVLMLIFKDSILGVVAGVQLSENDSLHVGDWIKVNGTDANGTVMEVSLTQVKILNWDKTVTTVPPYHLVSGSFTNYKNMQESHTRRISRSYNIDADSVVQTDDEMLAAYARIPLLKDWIDKKIQQRKDGKVQDAGHPDGLVDGSIDTNLGVFRAYLKLYLDSNPNISHAPADTCFVSTLAQTATGIPLQLYCFTATSAWTVYEAIQSQVFEHVAVMLYRFNLYTFENPTGRDTLLDGFMSPGKNPDVLFGIPYPFFNSSGTPQNPAFPVQKSASSEPAILSAGLSGITTPPASPSGQPAEPAASPK